MSALSGHVEDYLPLRRALGFKLEREGRSASSGEAVARDAGGGQDDGPAAATASPADA